MGRTARPVLIAEEQSRQEDHAASSPRRTRYTSLTENGFCYTFEYDELRTKRYVNMGNHVDDIVMTGGRIIAFGKKSVMEYEIKPGHNPEKIETVRHLFIRARQTPASPARGSS